VIGVCLPLIFLIPLLDAFSRLRRRCVKWPQKAVPEVDTKELQHWEPEGASWVEVQVQWVGSELEVEKMGWRPYFYGITLPVPMRPAKWEYWHQTV
jgi:hypothetical protein